MRQAITTKFIAPTSARGARVKATAEAGNTTLDWNYALGVEGNHKAAAAALAAKLEWKGEWIGGGTANGYAFVMVDEFAGFEI